MKNKILSILIIFVLVLCINVVKVNAETEACTIKLNPNSSSVKPEETIDISIDMSNITDRDGLAAYSATISFDNNIFTYSKTVGAGEWETPTYNQGNIVATVTSGNGQTEDQTIGLITLRVNPNVPDGQYEVGLSNITVSNGVDTLSISPVTTKVNVKKDNSNENNSNNDNNNNNSNNNSDSNNNNSNNSNNENNNNNGSNSNNNNNSNDKNNNSNDTTLKDNGNNTTNNDKNSIVSDKNNTKNNSTTNNSTKNSKNTNTDTTTTSKSMPYAGVEVIIIPAILLSIIVGIVSYCKYKKSI